MFTRLSAVLLLLIAPLARAGEPAGLQPIDQADWTPAHAAHLLARAGFGGTPEEVLALALMTPEQAVAHLVDYEKLPLADPLRVAPFDSDDPKMARARQGQRNKVIKQLRQQILYRQRLLLERALGEAPETKDNRRRQQSVEQQLAKIRQMAKRGGDPLRIIELRFRAGDKLSDFEFAALVEHTVERELLQRYEQNLINQVRDWWLRRMVVSQRPLEEKLILFWHGHFATSNATVRNSRSMWQQHDLLREHASGNFGQLVRAMVSDPAMLRYLDGNRNVKGKPNENFARELMELFTLGRDNGYTEKDIKEAARALTGWQLGYDKKDKAKGRYGQPVTRFVERMHDEGEKTFLGKTGRFGSDDVIDIILARPECARWIATKSYRFFVGGEGETEVIESLAETLRQSNYELKPMLRRLFRSRVFYASSGQAIKSPAELVAGTLRSVGMGQAVSVDDPLWAQLARQMSTMGQALFYPPNVKGWDGGRAWVNSATMLKRYNFLKDLSDRRKGGRNNRGASDRIEKLLKAAKTDKQKAKLMRMREKMDRQAAERWQALFPVLGRLSKIETAEGVVQYLVANMLRRPLAEERRAKLMATLAPAGEYRVGGSETLGRLMDTITLLTSMPEYQLN